jgi:hypothetical protein
MLAAKGHGHKFSKRRYGCQQNKKVRNSSEYVLILKFSDFAAIKFEPSIVFCLRFSQAENIL